MTALVAVWQVSASSAVWKVLRYTLTANPTVARENHLCCIPALYEPQGVGFSASHGPTAQAQSVHIDKHKGELWSRLLRCGTWNHEHISCIGTHSHPHTRQSWWIPCMKWSHVAPARFVLTVDVFDLRKPFTSGIISFVRVLCLDIFPILNSLKSLCPPFISYPYTSSDTAVLMEPGKYGV